MSLEKGSFGFFNAVHFDPSMSERDLVGYSQFVRDISQMPLASRYRSMATKPVACFMAVNAWKFLQGSMPEYQFRDQYFLFNQKVIDYFGYDEKGQDMLGIKMPGSVNILVLDVAGYLYGFSYENMLIAAGSIDYLGERVTNHYSQRYPGLLAKAVGLK